MLLRLYMLSVVALIYYIVEPGTSLFSWHPLLMTVGSMIMLYEGISLLVPKHGLLDGASRETKRNVHGILQCLALFTMFCGYACVIKHKNALGKPHFETFHSIIGHIAGVTLGAATIGGLATRFQRLTPVTPDYARFAHTVIALVAYFLICLTFVSGVFTDYMVAKITPFIQMIILSLPLLAFGTGFTHIINRLLQVIIKPK